MNEEPMAGVRREKTMKEQLEQRIQELLKQHDSVEFGDEESNGGETYAKGIAGALAEQLAPLLSPAAKPQDGSTVKGYRKLTADDIAQMNDLKEISRNFCEQLEIERTHLSLETVEIDSPEEIKRSEALRCLAIARTKMQEACMWACRAVARPDADC